MSVLRANGSSAMVKSLSLALPAATNSLHLCTATPSGGSLLASSSPNSMIPHFGYAAASSPRLSTNLSSVSIPATARIAGVESLRM